MKYFDTNELNKFIDNDQFVDALSFINNDKNQVEDNSNFDNSPFVRLIEQINLNQSDDIEHLFDILISKGFKLNIIDEDTRMTILHQLLLKAKIFDDIGARKDQLIYNLVEKVLEKNSNIQHELDMTGMNAVAKSVEAGSKLNEITKLLFEYGAKFDSYLWNEGEHHIFSETVNIENSELISFFLRDLNAQQAFKLFDEKNVKINKELYQTLLNKYPNKIRYINKKIFDKAISENNINLIKILGHKGLKYFTLPFLNEQIKQIKDEKIKGFLQKFIDDHIDATRDLNNAVAVRNVEKARELVNSGVWVNVQHGEVGEDRTSPIYDAVWFKFVEIVKLLVNIPEIDIELGLGNTDTPLSAALLLGHKESVQLLIDNNANPNVYKRDYPELCLAVEDGKDELAEILINAKNINLEETYYSSTALHLAAEKNNTKIVEKLLARGANINAQDAEGNTALHIAAKNRDSGDKLLKLLIDSKANSTVKNDNEQTPFDILKDLGLNYVVKELEARSKADNSKEL